MIRTTPLASPWTWAVPLIGLLLFMVISVSGLNQTLFLIMNHSLSLKYEATWINVTLFGDAGMVLVLVLPFVGRRPDLIGSGVLAGILAAVVVNAAKEFFLIDRPPTVLAVEQFHQLGNRFGGTSFPSGHTAAIFVFAGIFALLPFPNRLRIAVLLLAALVGISRIAVGAHWPADVAAGMVVGWGAAFIGVQLAKWLPVEHIGVQRGAAMLLIFTVYYLIFLHHDGDKQARLLEITVPLLCLAWALPGIIRLFRPAGLTHD
ncbi:MAG TPA: phosphatase PAP2 family protein [Gammaproteobacteria bacterium]|nr:phosphatase PAP2 family protein [Gammaproteobacteria bacterium]